jgi:Serine dehydrogenase proteinase
MELVGDVAPGAPVDLLLETNGGKTDATEAVIAVLQNRLADFRVIVANAAKSNGTLICLAARSIVMGPASELGPIDPQLNGIPCTILSDPVVAQTNFPLHQLAVLGLKQTHTFAARLLRDGMLKGRDPAEIERVVNSLASRDTYFSHGSVIDHREASALGLSVEYLTAGDPLWERIWILYCMYDFDTRRDDYLKIFEGRARSTAISALRVPTGTPA